MRSFHCSIEWGSFSLFGKKTASPTSTPSTKPTVNPTARPSAGPTTTPTGPPSLPIKPKIALNVPTLPTQQPEEGLLMEAKKTSAAAAPSDQIEQDTTKFGKYSRNFKCPTKEEICAGTLKCLPASFHCKCYECELQLEEESPASR
jgi:hypothetical protein